MRESVMIKRFDNQYHSMYLFYKLSHKKREPLERTQVARGAHKALLKPLSLASSLSALRIEIR